MAERGTLENKEIQGTMGKNTLTLASMWKKKADRMET